ncbi:MAG: T9SS type A sorting domain-containing protein [candidate division Zixibacteria bacterium]|nr:T9SS type A sorting domain-containing protein [candidate division Zixibacteria bacterium]
MRILQNIRNYPNPFNTSTEISFQLIDNSYVEITVFDLLGRRVATLVEGNYNAGTHSIKWDASEQPSGVYFYRLSTPEEVRTQRITLMK